MQCIFSVYFLYKYLLRQSVNTVSHHSAILTHAISISFFFSVRARAISGFAQCVSSKDSVVALAVKEIMTPVAIGRPPISRLVPTPTTVRTASNTGRQTNRCISSVLARKWFGVKQHQFQYFESNFKFCGVKMAMEFQNLNLIHYDGSQMTPVLSDLIPISILFVSK